MLATASDIDERPLRLTVALPGRAPEAAPAVAGFAVMELIRAHGLPIKAECGGAGVCASCHVRVADDWRDRLPPPSDAEQARLDELPTADDASRLCCQLRMTADLDGLEVDLQPDSIAA